MEESEDRSVVRCGEAGEEEEGEREEGVVGGRRESDEQDGWNENVGRYQKRRK